MYVRKARELTSRDVFFQCRTRNKRISRIIKVKSPTRNINSIEQEKKKMQKREQFSIQ